MKKSDGFSMIEVITVMGIIGILSSISTVSLIKFVPWYKMKSSTLEIASAMNTARFRSIIFKGNYGVFFDRTAQPNNYVVFKDNNDNYLFDNADTVIGGTSSLPAGVRIKGVKFGRSKKDTVVFLENGKVSQGMGSVYISSIDGEYAISVALTGKITVKR